MCLRQLIAAEERKKIYGGQVQGSHKRGIHFSWNYTHVAILYQKMMTFYGFMFYAEFNWDAVLKAVRKSKTVFEELNKFPTVRRDLALVIDNSVKFADIVAIARKAGKKLLKDINLFDVYDDESKLGKGKKSYTLSGSVWWIQSRCTLVSICHSRRM